MHEFANPNYKITDDKKEKIIDLWEQGLTGQAIGELIGISRCSVLGYINRQRNNGYQFKRNFEKNKATRDNILKQKIVKAKIARKNKEKAIKKAKAKPPIVKKDPVIQEELSIDYSVNLMGLKRLSCRYPISPEGAYEMIFCGRPQEHGSYCKEHGALCYYPSKYQYS